jgi:hypothetical protein
MVLYLHASRLLWFWKGKGRKEANGYGRSHHVKCKWSSRCHFASLFGSNLFGQRRRKVESRFSKLHNSPVRCLIGPSHPHSHNAIPFHVCFSAYSLLYSVRRVYLLTRGAHNHGTATTNNCSIYSFESVSALENASQCFDGSVVEFEPGRECQSCGSSERIFTKRYE